jgi:hypothetical protein
MEEDKLQQPSPELLAKFVAGDPIAEDTVLGLVLPQIYRWAIRTYSNLPEQEVQSVIHQVVAETCRPSVRYDPNRSKLTTYLIGLIKLRIIDLYEKQHTIKTSEESGLDTQEKLLRLPYNTVDEATRITRDAFFQEAGQQLGEVERAFLELMLQGEKRQETFVAILSRYGKVSDPAKEVKNTKERLLRALRGIAQSLGYHPDDLLGE